MSPWEKATKVLTEAKRRNMPWNAAWLLAMKALSPERTSGLAETIRPELEEDRELLRECKPWLRAAYENRDVTAAEFEEASAKAERRLDDLMAAA